MGESVRGTDSIRIHVAIDWAEERRHGKDATGGHGRQHIREWRGQRTRAGGSAQEYLRSQPVRAVAGGSAGGAERHTAATGAPKDVWRPGQAAVWLPDLSGRGTVRHPTGAVVRGLDAAPESGRSRCGGP